MSMLHMPVTVVVEQGSLPWALAALVLLGPPAVQAGDAPIIGLHRPECPLEALGTRPLATPADWEGDPVYVDFWASWCPPCAEAFPFMNDLQTRFGESGLHVLAVNLDEEAADAEAFLGQHPASFALAADSGGRCARAWGLLGVPTSFLIDRSGVVREVYQGFRDDDDRRIVNDIEALLAEPVQEASP